MKQKTALVCGAGGFIGSHLVDRLKHEDYRVKALDLKHPEFSPSCADEFVLADLRCQEVYPEIFNQQFDEVYQLAADMGGAGYIFTGENDARVMHNSAQVNLNIAEWAVRTQVGKLFYSSSACIYPAYNQTDPDNPKCNEDSAYPAMPDSEYGWEKLFSERLYLAYMRNFGLSVRIARFHNIYGPNGTWQGGKEKAPAAICRKVATAANNGTIDIWGDGKQTRSFLYISDCLDAVRLLMQSDFTGPVNIGSEEMVSIRHLAEMAIAISGKSIGIRHITGPTGVRGRNSDNLLIEEKLAWKPSVTLHHGLSTLYKWVEQQVIQLPSTSAQ